MRRVAITAFGRAANSSSLKYVAISRPNIGQANTAKMVISVQTMRILSLRRIAVVRYAVATQKPPRLHPEQAMHQVTAFG
jgi:hypothetical protein